MTGELARSSDPDDHQPEADPHRQLEATQTGEQAPGPETDKPDKG
jgi:hypothetical protein